MDAAAARSLKYDEEERFNAALLAAFDDSFELQRLLWHRLGRNLDDIVPNQANREQIVFELIRKANSGGWWAQLLVATRDSRPRIQTCSHLPRRSDSRSAAPVAPPRAASDTCARERTRSCRRTCPGRPLVAWAAQSGPVAGTTGRHRGEGLPRRNRDRGRERRDAGQAPGARIPWSDPIWS